MPLWPMSQSGKAINGVLSLTVNLVGAQASDTFSILAS